MGRRRQLAAGERLVVTAGPALDDEGRGRASARGLELLVAGLLPGERAEVEVEHVGVHGRAFGRARELLEASPDRVDPACPRFLACGGCQLQHASPALAARFKRQRVLDALRAHGLEAEVAPLVASPQPYGYRALAKLVAGPDGTLGSYAPRSHEIVDMRGCAIHAPLVERTIERARAALGAPHDLRYLVVRAALAEARVMVSLVVRESSAIAPARLVPALAELPEVAEVRLHVNASEGDAIFGEDPGELLLDRGGAAERLGEVDQDVESAAFSQVNPSAAERLYALAADALAPRGRRVLDLYSGSGGLALTFARRGAASVLGVERSREGVLAATRSAARMELEGVSFVCAQVEGFALPEADAICVNPPRRGLAGEVVEALARRAPFELVYVSCEPRTLARDLSLLSRLARLELARVTPVDLFPQTRHVEVVAHARVGAEVPR